MMLTRRGLGSMILVPALFLCLAAAASAELGEADRTIIRNVVQQQLDAFGRDDGSAAFAFASPKIKRLFGDAEHFMAMVRDAYQPVYRPREVEFRDIVEYQGQPTLRVLLVGPDGKPVLAYYMMEQQEDGSWRIDGCVLLDAPDQVT